MPPLASSPPDVRLRHVDKLDMHFADFPVQRTWEGENPGSTDEWKCASSLRPPLRATSTTLQLIGLFKSVEGSQHGQWYGLGLGGWCR